ncbi:MAG: beta-eliminating lyase-related protein [Thermoanaerobaculia bacterium]
MSVDLRSDNTLGASPEILEAVARAAGEAMSPYGADQITARLKSVCRDLFETDLDIVPVISGTAGNSLAIAAMTPPWGAVVCHDEAHIHRDELGAPEFFTLGAKLIPLHGADCKLAADDVARAIEDVGGTGRMAMPSCVSITQATEVGTVYSVDAMRAIGEVAHSRGAGVHLDGARFANAVAALGCSPADASWRAGVDILVFGATKNGAIGAELMVIFRRELTVEVARRAHRSGHRLSKARFLSAQMAAYLTDDLWLRNARHANALASRLASGLREIEGVEILRPVDANILVVRFAPPVVKALRDRGMQFYDWNVLGPGAVRLVTGFSTAEAEVEEFLSTVREVTAPAG